MLPHGVQNGNKRALSRAAASPSVGEIRRANLRGGARQTYHTEKERQKNPPLRCHRWGCGLWSDAQAPSRSPQAAMSSCRSSTAPLLPPSAWQPSSPPPTCRMHGHAPCHTPALSPPGPTAPRLPPLPLTPAPTFSPQIYHLRSPGRHHLQ